MMTSAKQKKCKYCDGRGYVKNNAAQKVDLCDCIKRQCKCSGEDNYMYYDKDINAYRQCICRNYAFRINKINKIYKEADIPRNYQWKFIEDIEMIDNDKKGIPNISEFLEIIEQTLVNYEDIRKRRGLLLWSELTGNGKTLAAAIILNTLVFNFGIAAKFLKLSSDYFGMLKKTYSNIDESEINVIKKLIDYDVLVIDDFGTQRSTEWENEKLYELIDGRNDSKKMTIITSNNNFEKIEETALYDRILSRIMEMCVIYKVKTPCYRQKFLIKK
ncbi:MAG TPA: ATP-binding protein [bacterium]|nr:ATP-binding protein [bacterium]